MAYSVLFIIIAMACWHGLVRPTSLYVSFGMLLYIKTLKWKVKGWWSESLSVQKREENRPIN